MIDVTFTQKDGRTASRSFHSYAAYVNWAYTFRHALLRYRAFNNLREIDSYQLPLVARFRMLFGG